MPKPPCGLLDVLRNPPGPQGTTRRTSPQDRIYLAVRCPRCAWTTEDAQKVEAAGTLSDTDPLGPLTFFGIKMGAGRIDPKKKLHQVARKGRCPPLSPEVRPGQKILAPQGGRQSHQTPGNVSDGIFILRTSFFTEGGGRRERGCPWPQAPGRSREQRPRSSALCWCGHRRHCPWAPVSPKNRGDLEGLGALLELLVLPQLAV